jgi:hypothetical protein
MTLIKSLLLGSAAGIVIVASAQAADLPTKKAAPVEYVRVCNVGGITGWTLPGSDTCAKFSGYITAHFIGGSVTNQYNSAGAITSAIDAAVDPFAAAHLSQVLMVEGGDHAVPVFNGTAFPITLPSGAVIAPGENIGVTLPNQRNAIFNRNTIGWNVRANFGFDLASNTAYGPLIGHFDLNSDLGNGFDSPGGASTYINTAYITWAGFTAGKAQSFFSFIGGGDNWNNFFSPDRKGFNEPNLIAYTASFGGGFSATISAESQGPGGVAGSNMTGGYGPNDAGPKVTGPTTFGGERWPDIVAALHVKQGWGEAQVSGVAHNVNVRDYGFTDTAVCGLGIVAPFQVCNATQGKVGWAIDAGVKWNLPQFGAGDDIILTGVYSQNAMWYSGWPDAMNGENGQVNGNGQPVIVADSYFNPLTNSWSTPRAWSVSTLIEHHWTPTFYTDFEGSVAGLNWSDMNGQFCTLTRCVGTGVLSPHAISYLIGADIGWNPVTNLNFDLELMYQHVNQDRPTALVGTVYNTGAFIPGAWQGVSSGFEGRLRITRYF